MFTEREYHLIQDQLCAGCVELPASVQQVLALIRRETVLPGVDLKLSPREHQMLALLVRGHTTREAALRLGIGQKTADTHRLKILKKLDMRGVVQLAYWALQHGWITTEELIAVWSEPKSSVASTQGA